MARGETRFGGERTSQVLGPGRAVRGGSIGITRQIAQTFIPDGSAAVATNYGIFFTAPAININRLNGATPGPVWQVASVRARWEAACTAGPTTFMVVKVPSGTAKAAGIACLAAGIDVTAAADTIVNGVINTTTANLQLNDGDSLALVPTGTLTSLTGLAVMVEMFRIKG